MKKIISLIALIIATIAASAQQTTLVIDNQTPGWLSSKINYGDQQTLVNLTVTGVINKTDLEFINKLMKTYSLNGKLDLSDAKIVEVDIHWDNPWKILNGRLKHFLFPKDLEEINRALEYVSVDTVTIGGFAMKTIYPNCFNNSAYVKHLIIREGVDSIKPSEPSFLSSLESVHLPSTLKTIGPEVDDGKYYAHNHYPGLFERCKKLTKINLPDSIEYFQDRSFIGTPAFADTVRLPKHLKEFYITTFGDFKDFGDAYMSDWRMCARDKQVFYIPDSVAKIHFETPATYMELHVSKKLPLEIDKLPSYDTYKKIHVYVPKSSLNDYLHSNWSVFTLLAEPNPATELTISQKDLSLQKGNIKTLSATILPDDADSKDIIWSTGDDNIASVSKDGKVTGINSGETYIFVALKDNPSLKDSCLIKVFQPVSSISLNLTEKEIKVGENFQLIAKVLPDDADDKNVLWKSEDDLIATVENGNVVGKKAGRIKIAAISQYDNTINADCYVTVLQPVEGISIDKAAIELSNIGESEQLLATVIPDDASNKSVNWKSSDEKVCIVSNGKVVAVGYGTSVVIATTVDGGYMATCSVTVKAPTGIEDIQENKSKNYTIFTVDGKNIESLQKGINIVRFDNGQTKKVTIK